MFLVNTTPSFSIQLIGTVLVLRFGIPPNHKAMKKLIVPICLLLIFSCKEKEDPDEYVANGIVPLNEANLTGSWDVVKVNYYALPNDSLVDSKVHPKKAIVLAFKANKNLIAYQNGSADSIGMYTIVKKGDKNYLVFTDGSTIRDSNEVLLFNKTTLLLSTRMDAITGNKQGYSKVFLQKL